MFVQIKMMTKLKIMAKIKNEDCSVGLQRRLSGLEHNDGLLWQSSFH